MKKTKKLLTVGMAMFMAGSMSMNALAGTNP